MKKLNFTEDEKLEIYNLYQTTRMTNEDLGKKFGVSTKTIYNIRKDVENKFVMNGGKKEHGKKITMVELNGGGKLGKNKPRGRRDMGRVESYQIETSTNKSRTNRVGTPKEENFSSSQLDLNCYTTQTSENKKVHKYVDDPTVQDYIPRKRHQYSDIISIDTSEINSDEEIVDIIPTSTQKSTNTKNNKQQKKTTNAGSKVNKKTQRAELRNSTLDFLNNQKTIMNNRPTK